MQQIINPDYNKRDNVKFALLVMDIIHQAELDINKPKYKDGCEFFLKSSYCAFLRSFAMNVAGTKEYFIQTKGLK